MIDSQAFFIPSTILSLCFKTVATITPTTASNRGIQEPVSNAIAPPIKANPATIAIAVSLDIFPVFTNSWKPTTNSVIPPIRRPIAAPTGPKAIAKPATKGIMLNNIPFKLSRFNPFFQASTAFLIK